MTNTGWAIAGVVLLIIIAGAVWYMQTPMGPASPTATTTPTGDLTGTVEEPTATTTTSAPMTATVTHSATGFSPATVTIAKGGTVTFIHQGSGSMWVASNQHPTHTLYAGTALSEHCPDGSALAFDQCHTGTTYSFKFDKAGTWQYHNHSNSSEGGAITVK